MSATKRLVRDCHYSGGANRCVKEIGLLSHGVMDVYAVWLW